MSYTTKITTVFHRDTLVQTGKLIREILKDIEVDEGITLLAGIPFREITASGTNTIEVSLTLRHVFPDDYAKELLLGMLEELKGNLQEFTDCLAQGFSVSFTEGDELLDMRFSFNIFPIGFGSDEMSWENKGLTISAW